MMLIIDNKNLNYFELFDIDILYEIDIDILDIKYFQLQNKYHPDMISDHKLKEYNIKILNEINNGYKILKDAILRAEYILSLYGFDTNMNHKQYSLGKELEEIFFEFENLENIYDLNKLKSLYEDKIIEKKNLLLELNRYFTYDAFDKASRVLIKIKYIDTLLKTIDKKIKNANNWI